MVALGHINDINDRLLQRSAPFLLGCQHHTDLNVDGFPFKEWPPESAETRSQNQEVDEAFSASR